MILDPIAPLDFCWNETDLVILAFIGIGVTYVVLLILMFARDAWESWRRRGDAYRLRVVGCEAEDAPKKNEEPELPPVKNGRYR